MNTPVTHCQRCGHVLGETTIRSGPVSGLCGPCFREGLKAGTVRRQRKNKRTRSPEQMGADLVARITAQERKRYAR